MVINLPALSLLLTFTGVFILYHHWYEINLCHLGVTEKDNTGQKSVEETGAVICSASVQGCAPGVSCSPCGSYYAHCCGNKNHCAMQTSPCLGAERTDPSA